MQSTDKLHQQRINEAIHQIHVDLSQPICVATLAEQAHYSKFHFQRLFRQVTGSSVNQYVRTVRLEWAANIMVFQPEQSIAAVADLCGFQSIASFCHRFKEHFGVTAKQWRTTQYQQQPAWQSFTLSTTLTFQPPELIRLPEQQVIYQRHQGYDPSIRFAWQQLFASAHANNIKTEKMIGLYHSNPLYTERDKCRFVAAMTFADQQPGKTSPVSRMSIPGGLFLNCRAQGEYGDILNLWQYLHYDFLPKSAYQLLPIPAHVLYHQNHLLAAQPGHFDIELRIPLQG